MIYDHLWVFCTTNYMEKYKITTNALEWCYNDFFNLDTTWTNSITFLRDLRNFDFLDFWPYLGMNPRAFVRNFFGHFRWSISGIGHFNPRHFNPRHLNPRHLNPRQFNPRHFNPRHFNPPYKIYRYIHDHHLMSLSQDKACIKSPVLVFWR